MAEPTESLLTIAALVDDAHWALESAGLVLGVETNRRQIYIKGGRGDDKKMRSPYDKEVLQEQVDMAILTEVAVREAIGRFREQTTYTAEHLKILAVNINELALRVQYLSTLAAAKPFFESHQRQVRNNRNFQAMLENQKQFVRILRPLANGPERRIGKLAELYDISGIPTDALEYFMQPGENQNDRRAWLREHLKRRGLYVGRRGRPRKPRSSGS